MPTVVQNDALLVSGENDLVIARHRARSYAKDIGLGLVDETKLVTAVSELTRNMLLYAGGGKVFYELVMNKDRKGIRVTFEDHGPGIADIEVVMQDGYSSINGLGLGLPGARRLVHEFEIASEFGKGTRVVITRWK